MTTPSFGVTDLAFIDVENVQSGSATVPAMKFTATELRPSGWTATGTCTAGAGGLDFAVDPGDAFERDREPERWCDAVPHQSCLHRRRYGLRIRPERAPDWHALSYSREHAHEREFRGHGHLSSVGGAAGPHPDDTVLLAMRSVQHAATKTRKPTAIWVVSTYLVLITVAVVVVAIALGVSRAHGDPGSSASGSHPLKSSSPTLIEQINDLNPAVLSAVGSGGEVETLTSLPKALPLVDASGKPIVFFVGSEACGACAAERWSIVVALSRFGTFSHLPLLVAGTGTSKSAITSTFTFVGSAYSSKYVTFVGVEQTNSTGKALETLTAKGQLLMSTYDAPPYVAAVSTGQIPWLDIGNRYATQGNSFLIQGLAWGQIASRLTDSTDPVTRAILGSANYFTAAICKATSMQPPAVCQGAPVAGMIAKLP